MTSPIPELAVVLAQILAVVLFVYWAWYTFLFEFGLLLDAEWQTVREGLRIGFRTLPMAMVLSGIYLCIKVLGKPLPVQKISRSVGNKP